MNIDNPNYRPSDDDLHLLTRAVHATIAGTSRVMSRSQRTQMSQRLAREAVDALLEKLPSTVSKRAGKGQSIIIDDKKIIYKGCSFVESVEFVSSKTLREELHHSSILLLIHVGIVVDGRVGKLKELLPPPSQFVDYYVIPSNIAIRMIDERAKKPTAMKKVYLYRHSQISVDESRYQAFGLKDWRNRFNILERELEL